MDRKSDEFKRVFENSLNGIDPEILTDEERETQEQWVEAHWNDLNGSDYTGG